MAGEKAGSVPELPLADPVTSHTDSFKSWLKSIVKYVILFSLFWFILHRGLFPLTYRHVSVNRQSVHSHFCTHDNYAWAMDAFAAKGPEVPIGQLAENFFL
jgi:hypothetical protein